MSIIYQNLIQGYGFLLKCVLFALTCLCFSSAEAEPADPVATPHIVFLNPGESVDRGKGVFWPMTAHLMAVAAKSFGMQLEVLYAERDHLLMLEQAQRVAQRPDPPDYVVLVNEKLSAPTMLQMFAGSATKIILIHNDMTAEQRREIGNERGQMSNWIGTVTTDEARGAYRMMDELYRQLKKRAPQVIGITGDRGTPVSEKRARGVSDYMNQSGRGEQLQLAFSDWSATDAQSKAEILLARYPQANIIWAANYAMASGALQAVTARDADILVGSTATAPYSIYTTRSIDDDKLTVSLASHFFIGAWAMVLLYDYHQQVDFASYGGVQQQLDYLYVINSDNAACYYQRVYEQTDKLDFRVFSKYLYPSSGKYVFSLAALLCNK